MIVTVSFNVQRSFDGNQFDFRSIEQKICRALYRRFSLRFGEHQSDSTDRSSSIYFIHPCPNLTPESWSQFQNGYTQSSLSIASRLIGRIGYSRRNTDEQQRNDFEYHWIGKCHSILSKWNGERITFATSAKDSREYSIVISRRLALPRSRQINRISTRHHSLIELDFFFLLLLRCLDK